MAKLKRLRATLKYWNKNVFRNVDGRIKEKQSQRLEEVQKAISENGYTDLNFEEEVSLQADLNIILEQKNSLWRQKSREDWLKDGDRNTSFFHVSAKFKKPKAQHWGVNLL